MIVLMRLVTYAWPVAMFAGGLVAVWLSRHDPGDRRQAPVLGGRIEGRQVLDVVALAVGFDVGEGRQRVPDRGRARALGHRDAAFGTLTGVGVAVWLNAALNVVSPREVVGVQQVSQVRPRVTAELLPLAASACNRHREQTLALSRA
jgi:hypothetical protein